VYSCHVNEINKQILRLVFDDFVNMVTKTKFFTEMFLLSSNNNTTNLNRLLIYFCTS